MITQKMKYALKALLTLADEAQAPDPQALTIEEIARRSGAPKRFLEHILLEIRNAGYIASTRGRSGGYQLIKSPAEVSRNPSLWIETPTLANFATVLTISDQAGFVQAGGMIGLRVEDNRVRFDVNLLAAQRAGLTMSSQMLKLAGQVLR